MELGGLVTKVEVGGSQVRSRCVSAECRCIRRFATGAWSQPPPQPVAALILIRSQSSPQPRPQPQPQPQQLRNSPADRVYFVMYTSVRRQLADEGVWSALSLQHRWGRERLLRAESRARQVLEVARAADAQATMLHRVLLPMGLGLLPLTMLRRASSQRAMLQLLEAEWRARILPQEWQGRERVLREAAGAKRQREIGIWETRCQAAP